ncbi:MAG TPA: hypothetical protein VJT31_03705 [Rugosimonospora sp.]|nr:hypothetical protein [Rugosimonospora sp.]
MLVLASCPVEVVRFTGGWLFDRVMAGWEATVLLAHDSDARPLRILGARTAALAAPVRGMRPQAVVVEAELYASDPRVRRIVKDALEDGAEVKLWGNGWPADLDGGESVQHRLSVAARAFKAQAMAAADVPVESVPVTETFRTGEPPRVRTAADLIPVS